MFTPLYSLSTVVGAGVWLAGVGICLAFYLSVMLCLRRTRTRRGFLRVLLCGAAATALCDVVWWVTFYENGDYVNSGLAGAAMLFALPVMLCVAGCVAAGWNHLRDMK